MLDADHTEISFGGQFKLEQHPHWSPLGVEFAFSDEHPRHFYMGVPPGKNGLPGVEIWCTTKDERP